MKKILLILGMLIFCASTHAQTKKEQELIATINQFTQALVNPDSLLLQKLVSPQLQYGHSGGLIENASAFIQRLTSGKSDFVSIQLTNQTVLFRRQFAMVRHQFDAITNDGGKPGEAHLNVLTVWERVKGKWVLLQRQAVKRS